MAMKVLLNHLRKYGIKTEDITIHTDNGAEFNGGMIHHNRGFVHYLKEVEKTNHIFIPPRYPNSNADVKSNIG